MVTYQNNLSKTFGSKNYKIVLQKNKHGSYCWMSEEEKWVPRSSTMEIDAEKSFLKNTNSHLSAGI